jgi:hypothetical protein
MQKLQVDGHFNKLINHPINKSTLINEEILWNSSPHHDDLSNRFFTGN